LVADGTPLNLELIHGFQNPRIIDGLVILLINLQIVRFFELSAPPPQSINPLHHPNPFVVA